MVRYGKLIKLEDQLYLLINWKDLQAMILELGERISKNYQPNLIIGILRGGMIVANLLSDYLFGNKRSFEILAIRCRSWSNVEEGKRPTESDFILLQDIPWSRLASYDVLIVDDVSDTGTTLQEVKKIVANKQPRNLKTACLHVKDWSKTEPDFYVEKVSHKIWISYPWEITEILESAMKKMVGNGYSLDEAGEKVKRAFDYLYRELEDETIKKVFEKLKKSVNSN